MSDGICYREPAYPIRWITPRIRVVKVYLLLYFLSVPVGEKVTSIKVDPGLWKKVKMLAVERGVTLKALVQELLESEVEAASLLGEELEVTKGLEALLERRKRGEVPFVIDSDKTAVELVREVRGE